MRGDSDFYFDRAGQPVSLRRWLELREDHDYRRVAEETVEEVWVSTVWLGLNHALWDSEHPLIFETMVFGGPMDQECRRYNTEEQARAGHAEMVTLVRTELEVT